jgi:hypothetical protein
MTTTTEIADQIKALYPNVSWEKFEDCDRALNWELWHGPLPYDYWTVAEPLDHYVWLGFEQAERDLREMLDPVPRIMYLDRDCDYVTETNPEDDDGNYDEDYNWIGSESWERIDPWEKLMFRETYRQVAD